MPRTHQMNVLRVFLASPSDLGDERKETKKLVDRINSTIRETGWTVELLGWEERLPGYGRPQAQINEDVDACDLFLGVLWRRWGSPTGEFSSGFEEEFERAVSSRRESDSPEIWIYFKQVDDTSDPGEQLRQVLGFRRRVEQRRELFYQRFRSTSEWETSFHDDLLKYVLKRASLGGPGIQLTASITAPSRLGNFVKAPLNGAEQELPEQLRRVSVAVGDAAREPGSMRFNAQLLALNNFDLVRLHLLGASLLYESVGQDVLSYHTANLVYRYRDALGTLTDAEERLGLASLLRDGNRYVPGWYWVRNMPSEEVAQLLENIVMVHPDEDVRTSTLKLLSSRPALPGMTRTNDLVSAGLDQFSDEVRTAALDYAARYGDWATVDIIDTRICELPEPLERKARVTIERILRREDPKQVLDRLIESDSGPVSGLPSFIDKVIDTLDGDKLHRMLRHKSTALRVMASDGLARKGLLTVEQAKALLTDSDTRVRAIGIRRLIVLGEPLTAGNIRELLAGDSKEKPKTLANLLGLQDTPHPDDLVEELFSTLSYEKLFRLVSWFTSDGRVAYKVLGFKHFDRFGDRVRNDLADQFATFHETENHALKEKYMAVLDQQRASDATVFATIVKVAEESVAQWADLDNFITSEFVRVALAALAKNGSASDLPIARQHLDSKDSATKEAALEIVSRFGDGTDVEPLLVFAKREYGDSAERAAETALALSADRWKRAKQYLERGAMPFLRVGIDALGTHPEFPSRWRELWPYLFVDETKVRLATVKLLCSRLDSVDLVKLLNQCHEEETYYYDVITSLDRSIYGPTAWRAI